MPFTGFSVIVKNQTHGGLPTKLVTSIIYFKSPPVLF
jgi:hypothetical protein